jgi:formylglycine-generating enzyme required for sulfatase activity
MMLLGLAGYYPLSSEADGFRHDAERAPLFPESATAAVWESGILVSDASTSAPGSSTGTQARLQGPLPALVPIPAGVFIAGSDAAEREAAYRLDELAYGSDITRQQGWYERERTRGSAETAAYSITATPITNRQYAAFVRATGYPAPEVSRAVWDSYGLIHPYARTRRYAWVDARPPPGREQHPVVLVSQADARAYAAWLSRSTGGIWRLPSELEWEKAARGTDGRRFPWGDEFRADLLNSHDGGPFDTTPVGRFADGASPFGVLDAAGQVYEWTATAAGPGRAIVKGGSWDDRGCGVCRPAARHSRPVALKHILIGFRLVQE